MNVNMNISTSTDSRKFGILNQPNKKEQFKKVLNNQELISKNLVDEDESTEGMEQIQQLLQSLSSTVQSDYQSSATNNGGIKICKIVEQLDKSKENNKAHSQILDVLQKLTIEVVKVKGNLNLLKDPSIQSGSTNSEDNSIKDNLLKKIMQQSTNTVGQDNVDSEGNNKVKAAIMNFIEVAMDVINQNTEKPSKELLGEDKVKHKVDQIQNITQSLHSTFEMPVAKNSEFEINSIYLEQLIGRGKLKAETKDMLKNNLGKIVEMVDQSKGKNENYPKILDVLQKLTTEENSIKDDLLKKAIQQSTNTVGQDNVDSEGNNKVKAAIVNFIDVAIDVINQNTEKPSKELFGEDKVNHKVDQIQNIIQTLRSTFESAYEMPVSENSKIEINSIELEQFIGQGKLKVETKDMLKNNLGKIVEMVNQSKDTSIQSSSANSEDNSIKDDLLKKIMNQSTNTVGQDNLDSEGNNKVKAAIMNFIDVAIDVINQNTEKPSKELLGEDKVNHKVDQIQMIIQALHSTFESAYEMPVAKNSEIEINSINLDQFIGQGELKAETKDMFKNNLGKIVEMVNQSKGKNEIYPKILDVLQKLTTEVVEVKENLKLLKIPIMQITSTDSEDNLTKNNMLKNVMKTGNNIESETIPQNQMQNSSDGKKQNEFSGNSSSEEKFLNNLLGGDKDETKISKAVNFMNQFETVKAVDTSKVQTVNTVIDKSDFGADVIKNIKFMEINNIKDLIVKMNPKELGEITIKLTMESGIMKASISAQNKETYNLLNHNFQDISDKLKNMDIKIQSLDINVYEDSTFFNKESNNKNNNGRQNNNSKTNMILEEDEDISTINNYFIQENQVNKFV